MGTLKICNLYIDCKRDYKAMCKQKKKSYNESCLLQLESAVCDSKRFWSTLKRTTSHEKCPPNITSEQWYEHFKNVFNSSDGPNIDINIEPELDHLDDTEDALFNSEITDEEIIDAVKNINPNKSSAGNLVAEHFIYGIHILLPFIKKLFNRLYGTGEFPSSWTTSIIVPLFKKRQVINPDNYRGIALIDIFSKLYISILTTRETFYSEVFHKITESQAGFRAGYSTIDNGFILYSLVRKYLSRKGKKIYVAFVDFKKAFDSVNRSKLYYALLHEGVKGKLLQSIQSVYKAVKSCVRCNNENTNVFDCPVGLRQGCKLSPILFCLFINELDSFIGRNVSHGIQLQPYNDDIFLLMFADDIGLISDTIAGLQSQLNYLHQYCLEWKLNVNVDKTQNCCFQKWWLFV